MAEQLTQGDMDALFNALSSDQNTAPSNSAVPGPGAGDGAASDGDKSMSQEEIDNHALFDRQNASITGGSFGPRR